MTDPSRDRAIERLLAAPAGRPSRDAAGQCVDAEGVAAWLDGGVEGAAAERFEAHVAACASCQELLATVIRMTPVEVPALRAVPRRPWTAWALPLAAAAVLVLVVWTTWPGSSRSAEPTELKEESRMARAETPAPSALESAGPPAAPTATQAAPPGTTSPPPVANRAESRPSAVAPALPPAPAAARRDRVATPGAAPARQSAKAEDQTPSAPPAPPPIAETVAPRADAPAARAEAPATQADAFARDGSRADAPAQAPPPRAAAPAQAAAGEARARGAGDVAALARATQVLRDPAAAGITVQAPGAMWRWRASRVIEYSSDGGATWRPSAGATAAQTADILAGASPMPPAAWMVGRRGLVLVTVDGVRFEVRTPPAMVDLVVVQASDRQIAVVRGAAGNAWRTADGGRTWIAVAPSP